MSRLPFELLLSLRYLRPKRTFVSVISLISVVGVMLGVAVLIIVISVMSGFDRQLREKLLGFNSHLKVLQTQATMHRYEEVMGPVASNRLVKGVAPFVLGKVLLETQSTAGSAMVDAPWLRGIDPALEGGVSVLTNSVITGKFDLSGTGMLVGVEMAKALKLRVGDKVSVYSPRQLQKMKEQKDKKNAEVTTATEFEIRGIFDVGYFEFNSAVVVTSLVNAQDMYDLGDAVHGLLVMLHDPFKAGVARDQLREVLGLGFTIPIWPEENSGILNALAVEKSVMFYLLFFIMIVAAFGICSALITFVVQKTREIGILKAVGATNGQVMWIFLSQSVIVGVLGVITGFGLGILAVHYRNEFLRFMNRVTGWELFPASIYNFTELPALIVTGDIAIICGGSMVICVLAGIIPAWNAGRLKPVEALRHE